MAVITTKELILYSNLTATAATVAAELIPMVQDRIAIIANNRFETDLRLQDDMTFNNAARTIVAGNSFAGEGFLAGDDIYIYNSYRNDGFYTVQSVATVTLTLTTAKSVIAELSGRSILISVVKWPTDVKQIAARMVAYDYQVRPAKSEDLKSHSLGPFSETFSDSEDQFGYPKSITDQLSSYRIARLM